MPGCRNDNTKSQGRDINKSISKNSSDIKEKVGHDRKCDEIKQDAKRKKGFTFEKYYCYRYKCQVEENGK